ncbi:MAG: ferric reductase-like transmembrane domain-containing protein [Coriobacteriales bacterium]|nr:ferric reductase-like transmembrane domain-containing protein [Coriobacteriales bacterium]
MLFLISLVVVSVLVVVLQVPLKRYPVVFYLLALALTGLYLYANFVGAAVPLWRYLLVYLQRCSLALALFTLVMFAGVLPDGSKLRTLLFSLRRELSILGCILASGHVVAYAAVFLPRMVTGFETTSANVLVSLSISLILTVLLAVLTLTSFVAVHKAMSPEGWKRVQLLAYPFFGLIYVHLVLVLAPSALVGNASAVLSLTAYTVLFGGYLVLRVRKAIKAQSNETVALN